MSFCHAVCFESVKLIIRALVLSSNPNMIFISAICPLAQSFSKTKDHLWGLVQSYVMVIQLRVKQVEQMLLLLLCCHQIRAEIVAIDEDVNYTFVIDR